MRSLLSIVLLLLSTTTSFGWSKKGHDVICYIAECHLSKGALSQVDRLLGGRSMVYYSSWMDAASNSREYQYSKSWHYMNMERRDRAETAKRHKDGDLLSASTELVSTLRSSHSSEAEQSLALKMLIHIIGDMHQPMHLGRPYDVGGNLIPVVYFTESTSLHGAWDYHIVNGARDWSYTEWQQQIDRLSDEEVATITSGSFVDWINESHTIAQQIYHDTPAETQILYDYMDRYTPVVEQQLLYAGLRLSHILNEIYAPESH